MSGAWPCREWRGSGYVDVAGNLTNALGVVGQVSGNYGDVIDEIDLSVHSFLFGVRGNVRRSKDDGPLTFGEDINGFRFQAGVNIGLGGTR